MFEHFFTSPGFGFLWIAGWLAASVVYRCSRGKPVLFFGIEGADFIERFASGRSNDTWYAKLGGASNCLVVAVAQHHLIVRPIFPFNLLFLPEIYGLEHVVPVDRIVETISVRRFLRTVVLVRFRDPEAQERQLTLYVKKPEMLITLLRHRSLWQVAPA